MLAIDEPQAPAATLVFQAVELLEYLIVTQGKIVATDEVPAAGHRPCPGHVDLFQRLPAKTVSQIQDLVGIGTVLQSRLRFRRPLVVRAPLMPYVNVQIVKEWEAQFGDVIRRIGRQGRFARQRYTLLAEIYRLSDRRGH